eukprot:1156026-Pelagomonas_calceolata.AAC.3
MLVRRAWVCSSMVVPTCEQMLYLRYPSNSKAHELLAHVGQEGYLCLLEVLCTNYACTLPLVPVSAAWGKLHTKHHSCLALSAPRSSSICAATASISLSIAWKLACNGLKGRTDSSDDGYHECSDKWGGGGRTRRSFCEKQFSNHNLSLRPYPHRPSLEEAQRAYLKAWDTSFAQG